MSDSASATSAAAAASPSKTSSSSNNNKEDSVNNNTATPKLPTSESSGDSASDQNRWLCCQNAKSRIKTLVDYYSHRLKSGVLDAESSQIFAGVSTTTTTSTGTNSATDDNAQQPQQEEKNNNKDDEINVDADASTTSPTITATSSSTTTNNKKLSSEQILQLSIAMARKAFESPPAFLLPEDDSDPLPSHCLHLNILSAPALRIALSSNNTTNTNASENNNNNNSNIINSKSLQDQLSIGTSDLSTVIFAFADHPSIASGDIGIDRDEIVKIFNKLSSIGNLSIQWSQIADNIVTMLKQHKESKGNALLSSSTYLFDSLPLSDDLLFDRALCWLFLTIPALSSEGVVKVCRCLTLAYNEQHLLSMLGRLSSDSMNTLIECLQTHFTVFLGWSEHTNLNLLAFGMNTLWKANTSVVTRGVVSYRKFYNPEAIEFDNDAILDDWKRSIKYRREEERKRQQYGGENNNNNNNQNQNQNNAGGMGSSSGSLSWESLSSSGSNSASFSGGGGGGTQSTTSTSTSAAAATVMTNDPSSGLFSFSRWSCLVDSRFKSKLLQIEGMAEQQQAQHDAMNRAFFELFTSGGGASRQRMRQVQEEMFCMLKIDRNNLLQSTLREINRNSTRLHKPLRVAFGGGEKGIDAGGVTKEFFQLITRELLTPSFGMFTEKEADRVLWFRPDVATQQFITHEFVLVGQILGLATYNNVQIDVHFPPALYRKLLNYEPDFQDLKQVDSELAKGLQQLLDYDETAPGAASVEDVFCRNFTIEHDVFGQMIEKELVPNGKDIELTSKNRHEFVKAMVKYLLNDGISIGFSQFKKGFLTVAGREDMISSLHPTELEELLCGQPTINLAELKETCEYEGYKKGSKVIGWFWNVLLTKLDHDQQRKFLHFMSGSDRVPIGGLRELNFKIGKNGDSDEQLPTASTCFNHLLLPKYSSEEVLEQKLLLAIENCEGFGLE